MHHQLAPIITRPQGTVPPRPVPVAPATREVSLRDANTRRPLAGTALPASAERQAASSPAVEALPWTQRQAVRWVWYAARVRHRRQDSRGHGSWEGDSTALPQSLLYHTQATTGRLAAIQRTTISALAAVHRTSFSLPIGVPCTSTLTTSGCPFRHRKSGVF